VLRRRRLRRTRDRLRCVADHDLDQPGHLLRAAGDGSAEAAVPSALPSHGSGATVTANSSQFAVALNQRNSQRWTASQESQMLICRLPRQRILFPGALAILRGQRQDGLISRSKHVAPFTVALLRPWREYRLS